MKRNEALKMRSIIEQSVTSLDDTTALEVPTLFSGWLINKEYGVDVRVCYKSVLYKCLAAHTSQNDWTPDVAVSLWVRIDDPAIEYPEWVQPTGAHDAYAKGAKVSHNGSKWISSIDTNAYEPGVYGWVEQT